MNTLQNIEHMSHIFSLRFGTRNPEPQTTTDLDPTYLTLSPLLGLLKQTVPVRVPHRSPPSINRSPVY
jgi:hypothetical protein